MGIQSESVISKHHLTVIRAHKSSHRRIMQEQANQETIENAKRPSSSILGIRDGDSSRLRYSIASENSEQLEMAFTFDAEIMASEAYRNCFASLIKKNIHGAGRPGTLEYIAWKRDQVRSIIEDPSPLADLAIAHGSRPTRQTLSRTLSESSLVIVGPDALGGQEETSSELDTVADRIPAVRVNKDLADKLLATNIYSTTGKGPEHLVGATTTIVGDKLYVIGGRFLETPVRFSHDTYELDLLRGHWTLLEIGGNVLPPRYFHTVCALDETELVCFGGLSSDAPAKDGVGPLVNTMSDIHILNLPAKTWTRIETNRSPTARYAHCAAILSPPAPQSSEGLLNVQQSPKMVVLGGQDETSNYIQDICVFDFENLEWTSVDKFEREVGCYRSITVPLNAATLSAISNGEKIVDSDGMLIFSNFNFQQVQHELLVRLSNGTMIEKEIRGDVLAPGLRFPNGGVVNGILIVCGTFLTTKAQRFPIWGLDLTSLTWSPIKVDSLTLDTGSWNRGVIWESKKRLVVLGDKDRNLTTDYNIRRLNFSDIVMVELDNL